MLTHRSILDRLPLSLAVCFLLCGIASAEIPELLSLIDNTSNDFTISKAGPCWEHIIKTREVGVYIPGEFPDAEPELLVAIDSN